MIKYNKDIKGIFIEGIEYKASQFADDTTLTLDGSQKSLQAALNTLEIFGSISGLKMNTTKTKVIWIGRKRYSKDKLVTSPMLEWGNTEFDLLGLKFSINLDNMIKINYEKYITQMKTTINHWNKRYLTPLGKITVIKSLIISKFIHLFTSLPKPDQQIIKIINNQLFSFIWDNKPDKIKRTLIKQEIIEGGLNMIDVDAFIKSLKISWIKKLIASHNEPWAILFQTTITKISNLINLGPLYIDQLAKNITNPFWNQTLSIWVEFCTINKPTLYQEIITSPIWYNPQLNFQPKLIKNWFTNKIFYIQDLINVNKILNEAEVRQIYNTKQLDFLTFHRLHSSLRKYVKDIDVDSNASIYPIIPYYIKVLLNNKKGTRPYYKIFQKKTYTEYTNPKWINELNIDNINKNSWHLVFKICFNNLKNNYLTWFQYKILNRTLGVNSLLFKMKISLTPNCRLCEEQPENLIHLFCLCDKSVDLWNKVIDWINQSLNISIIINNATIILGYLLQNNYSTAMNTIIICTKSYIFRTAYNKGNLQLSELVNYIKSTYSDQKSIAKLNNKLTIFNKKWNIWSSLF